MNLRESAVDSPEAHALLAAYFQSRVEGFAQQGVDYTTRFPDPATFTPPAGVFVLLLDDEGSAVGCGGIRRISDGPLGARFEVKHLYLDPATRGRGWGRLLLEGLESRALALGARELVLDTHHSLRPAAALYAAMEFSSIEPYNDNPNATVWMSKTLSPVAD